LENAVLSALVVALCSIMIDFIMGVLISIKDKTFSVNKLPQFLASNIFPYAGGLTVVALLAIYVPELNYLFYAGIGFVTLKFSKEALIDKLKRLLI